MQSKLQLNNDRNCLCSTEEKAEIQAKYDKFMKDYPLKEEVEVEKERLKFATDSSSPDQEDDDDTSIEDFFLRRYHGHEFEDDENHQELRKKIKDEEARIEKLFQDSTPQERPELIPNPELDLTPRIPKEGQNSKLSSSPTSSGENEEIAGNKRKKFKKKKARDSSDEEFGSGSGSRKKKRSSKSSEDDHKQKKKDKKKHTKPPKNGGSYKTYDLNNNWSVDSDRDSDEDDHKRKKYHSKQSSGEDFSPPGSKREQAVQDSNWLLERTKVREAFRNMDPKLGRPQHSSGKKAHNWQIDRDSQRQRVRNKKSDEDRKSFSY